jgi:hypothetical protein
VSRRKESVPRQRGNAVGRVSVLPPKAGGRYYRLTWTKPDGTPGRTTAGRDEAGARAKAAEIDAGLRLAGGPDSHATLREVRDAYTSSGSDRNQRRGDHWTETHRKQIKARLDRALRLVEGLPAWAVDRALLDSARAQAGTRRTVRENTSALRGMLRWGHEQGIFSAEQADLLPVRCVSVKPALTGTAAPRRGRDHREVGEHETYVRDEDAPSVQQVQALGDAFQERFAWGRLAVELAADSGPRWGEQYQLTAHDVVRTSKGRVRLRIDWQVDPAARVRDGGDRRKRPKGEKTRTAGVRARTTTGYSLREELLARRQAALSEQAAGTNPQALLFPTKTGKMWHHSAWQRQLFAPAAEAAGWPVKRYTVTEDRWSKREQRYVRRTSVERHYPLVWHSLRHRFARTCIDVLRLQPGQLMAVGGWESEVVVKTRYYRTGKEHQDAALEAFDGD